MAPPVHRDVFNEIPDVRIFDRGKPLRTTWGSTPVVTFRDDRRQAAAQVRKGIQPADAKFLLEILVSIGLDAKSDKTGEGDPSFSDNGGAPDPGPTHHRIPPQILLGLSGKAGSIENRNGRSVEFVLIRPAEASKQAIFLG